MNNVANSDGIYGAITGVVSEIQDYGFALCGGV